MVDLELDFIYGPFVKEDLMHMIRSWTSTITHLVIRYRRDRSKIMTEKCIMKVSQFLDALNTISLTCFFYHCIKLLEPCINLEIMCFDAPEMVVQRFEYLPQNLTELYIPFNHLSLLSLEMLAQNNGAIFERLQIGSVDARQLKIICEQMNLLRTLALNTIDLEETSGLLVLKQLTRIEHLEFTLQEQHIDWELSEIASSCTHLKKLFLVSVSVSDVSLNALAEHCKDLRFLQLIPSMMTDISITDTGIERLAGLKKLHHVCLPLHRVSESAMCRLLEQPSITSLDIRGLVDYEQTLVELFLDKARANPSVLYKILLFRVSLECPDENQELPPNLHITRSIRLVDDSYEQFIQEANLNITE